MKKKYFFLPDAWYALYLNTKHTTQCYQNTVLYLSCKESHFGIRTSFNMLKPRPLGLIRAPWRLWVSRESFIGFQQARDRWFCWPAAEVGECGWKWFKIVHVDLTAIPGTANPVPYHQITAINFKLLYESLSVLVPDIPMSCRDFMVHYTQLY